MSTLKFPSPRRVAARSRDSYPDRGEVYARTLERRLERTGLLEVEREGREAAEASRELEARGFDLAPDGSGPPVVRVAEDLGHGEHAAGSERRVELARGRTAVTRLTEHHRKHDTVEPSLP